MTVLKSIFRPRTVTAKGFVLIALSSLIAASYLEHKALR